MAKHEHRHENAEHPTPPVNEPVPVTADRQQQQLNQLADELEGAFASQTVAPTGVAHAAITGIFPQIAALIAALRAGDMVLVANTFYDVFGTLLGRTTGGAGIEFQTGELQRHAAFARIDWGRFVDIFMKLLPLILGRGA